MTTNERIDHIFVKEGDLTLVVGHGPSRKRFLVNTKRMIEASRLLRQPILRPADHDPNHPHVLVRRPNRQHTQLYFLTDDPDAWTFLCAILYPKSKVDVATVDGESKLHAAQYAVLYEMKEIIRRDWPRLGAIDSLAWKDMWTVMNAAFLLEIPKEFDVLSREIIYGYEGSLEHLVQFSQDREWAQRVIGKLPALMQDTTDLVAAMESVRDGVRHSMMRIVGIASEICTETERRSACDNPKEQCTHQKHLAREIWGKRDNEEVYTKMAKYTPNQIRAFWSRLAWLRLWLNNARIDSGKSYIGKRRAEKEAEIFSRKWNSCKGPLGICLYCDASAPSLTRKCNKEFCRREYELHVVQRYGTENDRKTLIALGYRFREAAAD